MYRNILVGIDPAHAEEGAAALRLATHLAEDQMSRITAITVLEPIPGYFADTLTAETEAEMGTRALARLRETTGQLSEVKPVIRHGRAAEAILRYAEDEGIDCIVVASHRPGLSDYLLGSTAARVVRHAPCSVHVMR